jgi:hypothetical protein
VQKDKYFVVRIKNNWKLEFGAETGLIKIGSSKDAPAYRAGGFHFLNSSRRKSETFTIIRSFFR